MLRRTRERNCGTALKAEAVRTKEFETHNRSRKSRRCSSTGSDRESRHASMGPSMLCLRSTLPLLILGLFSFEMIPLPSMAFVNSNIPSKNCESDFEHRMRRRIRIDSRLAQNYIRASYDPLRQYPSKTQLFLENDNNSDDFEADRILRYDDDDDDDDEDLDDKEFLKRQLAHLESMEKMLEDIEEYCSIEGMCDDDDDDDDEMMVMDGDDGKSMLFLGDEEDLDDMESLFDFLAQSAGDDVGSEEEDETNERKEIPYVADAAVAVSASKASFSPQGLEEALLQGVVPVDAGVGSNTLPGDFGFDPLGFAEKDYVQNFQYRFLDALPGGNPENDPPPEPRPSALVLRDYREAEIRHGRLAMLAVVIWPIQEKLDQLLLDPSECGPILYGPVTLPYFPLFMTLLMMLLGYLDIYTKDIQEEEGVGDAFLPGDCFWDPLNVLTGAPASMKKNMQERELFNGRVAMVAFAAFVFEEATSHEAIVDIPGNEVLFVPAYQIPSVQEWLDAQFSTI